MSIMYYDTISVDSSHSFIYLQHNAEINQTKQKKTGHLFALERSKNLLIFM